MGTLRYLTPGAHPVTYYVAITGSVVAAMAPVDPVMTKTLGLMRARRLPRAERRAAATAPGGWGLLEWRKGACAPKRAPVRL